MTSNKIVSWTFKFNNGVTTTTTSEKEASEIRAHLDVDESEILNYARPESPHKWIDKTDWTAKEALEFYAAGHHFDVLESRTRILDTGEVAYMALQTIDPQFVSTASIDLESITPDAVIVPISLARKVGLLTCKHCGYPQNNHFDWAPYTCAHDGSCPGYKEGIRKDLVR